MYGFFLLNLIKDEPFMSKKFINNQSKLYGSRSSSSYYLYSNMIHVYSCIYFQQNVILYFHFTVSTQYLLKYLYEQGDFLN
jgi:hypothetical protein